ncbi:MAG: DUF3874 domain-containing protein [Tannerellaceae bacterium]
MSAADIFQRLKKHNPSAMRGVSPGSSQKLLMALGIERKHTGNTDGLNKEVLAKAPLRFTFHRNLQFVTMLCL